MNIAFAFLVLIAVISSITLTLVLLYFCKEIMLIEEFTCELHDIIKKEEEKKFFKNFYYFITSRGVKVKVSKEAYDRFEIGNRIFIKHYYYLNNKEISVRDKFELIL